MDSSMFPFGYDFAPTDEELLIYYLFHKIVGDIVPSISLPVIDIYSHEPAMIWQQCGGMEDKDIYFFTTLKKKKSRIIRKVGINGGTWSGESKGHKVFSSANNAPIGTIKRFHYETSGGVNANDDDCSWIMHEYTLDPTVLTNGFVHDSYVVCLIRKRILKKVRNTVSSTIQAPFVFNGPTTTQTDALYMDGVNKCPAQMIESQDDIIFANELEEQLEELNPEHSDNIMFANELENQLEELDAEHSDDIMFANEPENQLEELNAEHSDDIMFATEIENQLEELDAEHYDDIMLANNFENQREELNAEHYDIEKDSSKDFEWVRELKVAKNSEDNREGWERDQNEL
ncbi:transcription factor JUNGBRUNNEN 1-like [Cucurbita pepo subsp. pepo]|uniref:transcription factor JUNGBRUNNEN 1-like n=1 Tax=Cucurbita pepo subsp. pepo TaxID=3664 RepID=UPI000C9D5BA4|nr:transcription factor JUNGBRUNNEN 1-like [Cucurbita pepo subsp. pepo]